MKNNDNGKIDKMIVLTICVCANSIQAYLTLYVPMDCSLPATLFRGFSSIQEYWRGLLCPLPGDLPNPGIEPTSVMLPALAGRFFTTSTTWEALMFWI